MAANRVASRVGVKLPLTLTFLVPGRTMMPSHIAVFIIKEHDNTQVRPIADSCLNQLSTLTFLVPSRICLTLSTNQEGQGYTIATSPNEMTCRHCSPIYMTYREVCTEYDRWICIIMSLIYFLLCFGQENQILTDHASP